MALMPSSALAPLIGIGRPLTVSPLPHHRAYGSRTTAVRQGEARDAASHRGKPSAKQSACGKACGTVLWRAIRHYPDWAPAALAAWSRATPRWRSWAKRCGPLRHCFHKTRRNRRRSQASSSCNPHGVWQKPKSATPPRISSASRPIMRGKVPPRGRRVKVRTRAWNRWSACGALWRCSFLCPRIQKPRKLRSPAGATALLDQWSVKRRRFLRQRLLLCITRSPAC
jgi:hypothetical protein